MSLSTSTYVLGEERERLDERLDDLAEKLVDADQGSAGAQALRQKANETETQGGGLDWLISEYGEDAKVVVGGLNAGEFAEVDDRLAAIRESKTTQSGLPGARRNVFAAQGVQSAPFLEDGADSLDAKAAAVNDLPVGVVKWLYQRVNEETTVSEGNFKPLRERLVDRSQD